MKYLATKARVHNRGTPPDSFLDELIAWAKDAPNEIFTPNDVPVDIYTVLKPVLGTLVALDGSGQPVHGWASLLHRRAALMEAMRVHAGMESSWNWNEGVDRNNATSQAHKTGQETGIFQVSFDSEWLGHNAMKPFAGARGIETVEKFISAMKKDHALALEYYARLSRISIRWAGPLLRHGDDSVYPWLSRTAVAEFQSLLVS